MILSKKGFKKSSKQRFIRYGMYSLAALFLAFSAYGFVQPAYAMNEPPTDLQSKQANHQWQLYSEATAKWLWLDVYKAELYLSKTGETKSDEINLNQNNVQQSLLQDKFPLKLKLCYQQSLSAEQIIQAAEKVLPELDEQSELYRAVSDLHRNYQNVSLGDCYALKHEMDGSTSLLLNGDKKFSTQIKDFKKLYFGIWLGDNPLSEDVKKSLLMPQHKS